MRTLGKPIKGWSQEQGLFQRDMAEMIGVDEMAIINLEKGKTKLKIERLDRIRTL
jgi:DNA-binding XRE family transcriptional regulator